MAEDFAKCAVSINSSDDRFWTVTSTDGYYQCTDAGCSSLAAAQTDTTNNWKSGSDYILDDDPDNPFCTAATNTDFKCSAIKCFQRREMDTEDAQDFQFYPKSPAGTGDDVLYIAQGRAMVGINRTSGTDFFLRGVMTGTTPLEIKVVAGGMYLAAVGATIAVMLSF